MTKAVRGATCCENTREGILSAAAELLAEIFSRNKIAARDIVSVVFSATRDLDAVYPAVAARGLGLTETALFCVQEMYVEGSMPKCLRVLITYEGGSPPQHVYLREAVSLRPDLAVNKGFVCAVDGPGGSGKSTAAKSAAKALGFTYIDSGGMYRAVAVYCLERSVDLDDEAAVTERLGDIDITFTNGRLIMNGADVTDAVRSKEAGVGSSKVAVYPAVRARLVALQREIAEGVNVVMDGRDIGTNVFPDARAKIYMDASAEIRARRRVDELAKRGEDCDFGEILRDIEERDYRDKTREHSPLVQAGDAVYVDTGGIGEDAAALRVIGVIKERLALGEDTPAGERLVNVGLAAFPVNADVYRRASARGVCVRGGKALMIKYAWGGYGFPGGGVEDGETMRQAVAREMREEVGADVLSVGEMIVCVVHRKRSDQSRGEVGEWFEQPNYFFLCEVGGELGEQRLTPEEAEREYEPVWVDLREALDVNAAIPERARDVVVLQRLLSRGTEQSVVVKGGDY